MSFCLKFQVYKLFTSNKKFKYHTDLNSKFPEFPFPSENVNKIYECEEEFETQEDFLDKIQDVIS